MQSTPLRSWLLLLCLTFMWLTPNALVAQDASPDASRNVAANSGTAPVVGAADVAADKEKQDWERLIYLPYKNLKDVFEKQSATVFMPYMEYLRLWQKSGAKSDSGKPPVSAVITEAHYVARIDQDLARIQVTLKIHSLEKSWVEVPVRFGNAAVGKLLSPPEEVLLRGTGDGAYSLLFPKAGEHEVKLVLETRVRTSPAGQNFELECPTVGVTTFELIIPQKDQTVEVTPQLVSLPVKAAANETRIKANLGATTKIAVLWHPKASAKPEMALLSSVNNLLQVSIQDRLIHSDAFLQYEILRGEMQQLQIAVPLGDRILEVASSNSNLKGWSVAKQAKQQLVTVEFLSPVKNRVTIEVHTERALPADTFDVAGIDDDGVVHGIHTVDAVRESGQLVVAHAKDLTLAVKQSQGVLRINLNDVDKRIRRSDALYFKFYNHNFGLKVATSEVEPRITVDNRTRLIVEEDELRLEADLNYTIEKAGVFELRLNLPDDLTIDTVRSSNLKEYNVADGVLTVTLSEKRQGAIQLAVTGHRAFDSKAQETDLTLPILEPIRSKNAAAGQQAIDRETGFVAFYAPEAIEVITNEDDLKSARAALNPNVQPVRNSRLAAAWTFTRRPVVIPIKTKRKPTRLTATIATTINAKQDVIQVTSQLAYSVEFASVDTFRFSVLESVPADLQIQGLGGETAPEIKERTRAEEAVDGWVTWTVVMQREVLGQQRFEISYDIDVAATNGAAAADAEKGETKSKNGFEFQVQTVKALGLEGDADGAGAVKLQSARGEIFVKKDRALSVSAETLDDAMEAIDVRELQLISDRDGALAYRYFQQPAALRVTATKHDIQKVVETVVSRALVEIVIGRDQMATYRCRYKLKSSERQRLRIDLPKGKELIGMMVDRKQVNPEINASAKPPKEWESFFVNVARTTPSDEEFVLTVQFRLKLNAGFDTDWSGPMDLVLPQIGGANAEGGVVVQQLRTAIWVPDELALVGTPEGFVASGSSQISGIVTGQTYSNVGQENLESWIGGGADQLDFPTEGHVQRYSALGGSDRVRINWWRLPTYTRMLSAIVFLIALVLIRTRWENKLFVLLVCTFVAVLFAVEWPDIVIQGVAAARFGLFGMIAAWLVHALFGARRGQTPLIASEIVFANHTLAAVVPPPGVFDDDRKGMSK